MSREELLVKFMTLHETLARVNRTNQTLEQDNQKLSQQTKQFTRQTEQLKQEKADLKRQLDWFKRQLFGQKSERRLPVSASTQLHLGELLEDETPPPAKETVKQYQRKSRAKDPLEGTLDDSGLRFDKSVPVKEIEIPNPELEGLSEEEFDFVSEKVSYKLAQKPGAYVVLKYVRKTVKLKETNKLSTPSAPAAVIEKSYADVSFLAGLLIDKFRYHLPLYRQHERLLDAGIKLSRVTLTNLVHRTAALLEPIYFAQLSSILSSEVLLMDETPIKAGRKAKGKMQTGYFWPILGDKAEIAFPYSSSRAEKVVREALSGYCGVLVTDGYKVYEKYCSRINELTHAQCWAHTRRKFVEAEGANPELVSVALDKIAKLYGIEKAIKDRELEGEEKLAFRTQYSLPLAADFFNWLSATFSRQVLLPSSPFTKAANYALEREAQLKVFLEYPAVPLDTNEIERALRPIPLGRKNWMFCWTELGARYTGIVQSLIQSCRMQDIDPYTYLVDVLQRIDFHLASDVHLLTPRLWKEHFRQNPLRSPLDYRRQ